MTGGVRMMQELHVGRYQASLVRKSCKAESESYIEKSVGNVC